MKQRHEERRPPWAEAIVLLRKRVGITQQQLADVLGIARSTIACYETGRHRPRRSRMLEIFAFLTAAA